MISVKTKMSGVAGCFFLLTLLSSPSGNAEQTDAAFAAFPSKGVVSVMHIGSYQCPPCKLLTKIVKKLQDDYKGRAAIESFNYRHVKEQAKERFGGIISTSTLILFDKEGKEVYRHLGVLSENKFADILREMGVSDK